MVIQCKYRRNDPFSLFQAPLLFLLQYMHRFIQGQEGNWLKPNQFSVAKLTHTLSLTLTLTHSRTHAPTHTLVFVRPRPRPSIGNAAAAFLSTSLFDGSRFFAEIFCCCCLRLVLPSFIHHPELNAFIFPRLCWTRKHSSTNDRKWWLGKKARETSQVAQDPQF